MLIQEQFNKLFLLEKQMIQLGFIIFFFIFFNKFLFLFSSNLQTLTYKHIHTVLLVKLPSHPTAFSFSSKISFMVEIMIIIIITIIIIIIIIMIIVIMYKSLAPVFMFSRRDDQLISIYLNFFFIKIIIACCFFNVFCLRDNTF